MKILRVPFGLLLLFTIYYLLLPIPVFPPPPPGSYVSTEPADTESSYRKAYYTNLTRSEVMAYYRQKFPLALRLNHPPEFAFELVRDQTRSNWLEELVYPWKSSFYINGFFPEKPQDQFNYFNQHYIGKITLRYVPSHEISRLTVLGLTLVVSYWLIKEYVA